MKYALLHNWNFFRFLRLILGIAIIVQAVMVGDMLFGLAGFLLMMLAVFNAGCCGKAGCYPVENKIKGTTSKDIIYEEVDQ